VQIPKNELAQLGSLADTNAAPLEACTHFPLEVGCLDAVVEEEVDS
jgi:hypothetical protein